LIVLAGIITPLLATVAVLAVVRTPRAAQIAIALALGVVALRITGWEEQLSATLVTALGCLALGTAIARLIPRRWVVLGAVGMCLADVALLASGIGHTAGVLMAAASANAHGPVFTQATIGPISTDYPDLVFAAVLGGFLAGRHQQLLAAALVAAFGVAWGMLLPFAGALPATVPIGLTLCVLEARHLRGALGRLVVRALSGPAAASSPRLGD
jgi:hypothetical protein